jgi:hypothetical protein
MEYSSPTEVVVVLGVFWLLCGVNKYTRETDKDIDQISAFARSKYNWLYVLFWPIFTLHKLIAAIFYIGRPSIMFDLLKGCFGDLWTYSIVGATAGAAWGGASAFVHSGWLRIAAFFIVLVGLVFVVKLLSRLGQLSRTGPPC